MSDDGGIVGEVDEDSKKDEQKEDEKEGGEDKEQISNKRSLEDNGESDRNKRPATGTSPCLELCTPARKMDCVQSQLPPTTAPCIPQKKYSI